MSGRRKKRRTFTVLWEFRVKPGKQRAFKKIYDPEGDWAQLFRLSPDYLGTELLRDRDAPLRYLTIDHWTSRRAYLRFKKENIEAYKKLDARCEALTERERLLGEFDEIGSRHLPAESSTGRQEQCGTDTPVRAGSHQNKSGAHELPPYISARQIRAATLDDIPAIVALERDSPSAAHWPEPAYQRVFSESTPARLAFVIGDSASGLHGFVIARVIDDDCELENIVVERRSQSRGLATRLLQKLIESCKTQGAKQIFLEVRESNAPARGLYEKCGFALTGRRRAYYTNPAEDAILYNLRL